MAKKEPVEHTATIEVVDPGPDQMGGYIVVCSCGWRGEQRAFDLSHATLGFSDHLAVGNG